MGRDRLAAWIRTEDAKERRELGEMTEGPRAWKIVFRRRQIGVEEILPLAPRNGPRLELRQVDAPKRKHTQRFKERARLVGQREHDRRLVRHGGRQRPAADD